MSPTITVAPGIELVRINPSYSITLDEAYNVKVFFNGGKIDCVANYIEIIEHPDNLVLELYWSDDHPYKVTTLDFTNVQLIDFRKQDRNTLITAVLQGKD